MSQTIPPVLTEPTALQALLAEPGGVWRTLLDAIGDYVTVLDRDGTVRFTNRAPPGRSLNEVVGRSVLDFTAAEHRDAMRARLQAVVETGIPSDEYERFVPNENGRSAWYQIRLSPISSGGEVLGAMVIATDVTERYRVEEALRRTSEDMAAAQHVSHVGTFHWDIRHDVVRWSDELYRIYGLEPAEFAGTLTAFIERIHPDDRALVRRTIEAAIRDRRAFQFTERIVRTDGQLRILETAGDVRSGASGEPEEVAGVCQDVTERRRAEDELRSSEGRLRATLDASLSAFVAIDQSGRITAWNRTAEEMFGWAATDAIGRPLADTIIPPRDRAAHTEGLARTRKTGQGPLLNRRIEVAALRRDGTEFPAELAVTPVKWGDRLEYCAFVRDVTDRKAAEDALQLSEEKYRMVVTRSPLGVYRSAPDGQILMANPALVRMLKYDSVEDLTGRTMFDLYARPEERPAAIAELEARGDDDADIELQWKTKDGHPVWVGLSVHAVRGPDGSVSYYETFVRDVTARRLVEQALRDSEERLQLVGMATQDVPWDWNLLTNRFWVGEDKRALFGGEPGGIDLDIEAWISRVHPEDRDRVGRSLELAFHDPEHGRTWTQEYRFQQQDGSWAHVLDRGYVIRDSQGKAVRMVGSLMNVTERKRAEAELARSRAALRDLAAHRESVREEERTRIARELHDELGQTLTALKLDLAWLATKLAKPSRTIKAKLKAMRDLITETAGVTHRIAAELRPGVLDSLGIGPAIQWQAREFERRTQVKCLVQVPRDDGRLHPAQATAVFRILQEALTNVARHASATQVQIRFENHDHGVELVVRDNGRGVALSELDARQPLGILGMRERARAWGGELVIDSQPGQGTTLTLCMPAASREVEL